jgi:hypothetical protein
MTSHHHIARHAMPTTIAHLRNYRPAISSKLFIQKQIIQLIQFAAFDSTDHFQALN